MFRNYIDSAIIGILLSTSVFLECMSSPSPLDVHNPTHYSTIDACIDRIALLLYKNRLVLKQVTVQDFALLQLFIRLSLFMLVTVACVACVSSFKAFQTAVLTDHSRMVVSAFVYRMNKFRVVVQAARMYMLYFIIQIRNSNPYAVPVLAFLIFGTCPVSSIFSSAHIFSLISFLVITVIAFLLSQAPKGEASGRRASASTMEASNCRGHLEPHTTLLNMRLGRVTRSIGHEF